MFVRAQHQKLEFQPHRITETFVSFSDSLWYTLVALDDILRRLFSRNFTVWGKQEEQIGVFSQCYADCFLVLAFFKVQSAGSVYSGRPTNQHIYFSIIYSVISTCTYGSFF
jgi:hypothetical protein